MILRPMYEKFALSSYFYNEVESFLTLCLLHVVIL